MDFHGNIEMMLFSDKLDQLEQMDLNEPVAFKVKVTHTEMFTRISVVKIFTLKEVRKEAKKVQTKNREITQEPLVNTVSISRDLARLEELYRLIRQNPGSRMLKLCITSKLQNVVLDSAIRIDNKIIPELEKLMDVNVA